MHGVFAIKEPSFFFSNCATIRMDMNHKETLEEFTIMYGVWEGKVAYLEDVVPQSLLNNLIN